jgi:hypothetical protein
MKKYIFLIALIIVFVVVAVQAQTGLFVRFAGSDTVYKAYQTAAEFFSDGGAQDFSNVQVVNHEPLFGSVSVTSEYNASTTILNGVNVDTLIKASPGTLGSVIITTAGNTVFNLLDATTTDVTKRATGQSTTTIMIAQFPASAAVGTYTFDSTFSKALFFDVISGTLGTSTITWR